MPGVVRYGDHLAVEVLDDAMSPHASSGDIAALEVGVDWPAGTMIAALVDGRVAVGWVTCWRGDAWFIRARGPYPTRLNRVTVLGAVRQVLRVASRPLLRAA